MGMRERMVSSGPAAAACEASTALGVSERAMLLSLPPIERRLDMLELFLLRSFIRSGGDGDERSADVWERLRELSSTLCTNFILGGRDGERGMLESSSSVVVVSAARMPTWRSLFCLKCVRSGSFHEPETVR